jgi:hypothetical protein
MIPSKYYRAKQKTNEIGGVSISKIEWPLRGILLFPTPTTVEDRI